MSDESIKRMADLLRSGAAMLEEACPQCGSPLFKLSSGEVYCANCNRKVVIVKSDEEIPSATTPLSLAALEETLVSNLQRLNGIVRSGTSPDELEKVLKLINSHLEALERIRRIKKEA
jgi:UPF0148 protein